MNRHHIATATILLIIAAGTLVSRKGHRRPPDIQFAEMQTARGESNGTARPSPLHSSYSSNESEQATEDSQAMAGSDTDGPDSEGQDMDGRGTSRSARLDLASWRPQTAGDSSATVTLPADWRLTAVADGSASVVGPNGQQIVLGFQTLITPGSSNYAPYMGPVQALSWIARIQGIQLLRVLDRESASERNPSGEAEFLTVVTRQPDGATYKGLALVTTTQMQQGTWMLHVSCIAAPVDQFDAAAPTMMAIWNSWKLSGSYVQDGEDWAAQTRAQTGNMAMRDAGRAGHALDNQTHDFDNTLNGVKIYQDDTGQRYQVQFGAEQRFQRDCVSKLRNCSQVPTNELGPMQ